MTTPITKFFQISTRLASKVLPAATFGTGLFLGCDEDYLSLGTVPPDTRYLSVTKEDFADYLDADSEEYAYAIAYFAQDYTPDALIIGRSIQDATAPYTVISGGVTTAAIYAAISDGAIGFVDSDGNEYIVDDIDFTGVTSFALALGVINDALAALTYTEIPRLEECSFIIDNLGRLVLYAPGTARAPFTKFPDADLTYSTYTGVSDGKLKFTDDAGTPNTVEITSIDFGACLDMQDVLDVMNDELADLSDPAIDGLEDCSFVLDSAGVITFKQADATPGSTNPQISLIAASATGTDLYGASYLDGADQENNAGTDAQTGADARTISLEAVTPGALTDLFAAAYLGSTQSAKSGYDAETLLESLQAVMILTDFYNVGTFAEGGATTIATAEYLALASYVETQILQLDIVTYDADAKSALVTDDLVSQLNDLGLDRTTTYYTERTTQHPDAANAGFVFPQKAGSCSFAYNPLSGVSESGLLRSLTSGEMTALDDKHVIYICRVGDVIFPFKSLTCSGEEKRLILGIDWFNATCQIDIANDRFVKKIHTYDYDTFGAVESILYRNAKEAAARNIIYGADDPNYPFNVTMPDPSDFSAADKKTHVFTYEVFDGYVKSEILQWRISGTFEI